MMKMTLNKLRDESGQALILVLILLLLAGLIIGGLLPFMSTGLKSGHVFENKMYHFYAADAGIEDVLQKLKSSEDPFSPTNPYSLGEQLNEMDVTVEQVRDPVPTENGRLYTIKSTAKLDGETKTEIVAEIEVLGPTIAEGGWGGKTYTGWSFDMVSLSLTSTYTLIFGPAQAGRAFCGRTEEEEEEGECTSNINQYDLAELNMGAGTSKMYFAGLDDAEEVMGQNSKIKGVHYYQEGDLDYLLMVGEGVTGFDGNEIFKLYKNSDTGDEWAAVSHWELEIEGATTVTALSRRDDSTDVILFSILSQNPIHLGEDDGPFRRGEIIAGNFSDSRHPTYASLIDTGDILGDIVGNPENPTLDALAALEPFVPGDPRILLSFSVNLDGSDGNTIKDDDIAIWDPHDPNDPSDDTINLHIKMTGDDFPTPSTVAIKSWQTS